MSPRGLFYTCPRCGVHTMKNRFMHDKFMCIRCGYTGEILERVGALNAAQRLRKYGGSRPPFKASIKHWTYYVYKRNARYSLRNGLYARSSGRLFMNISRSWWKRGSWQKAFPCVPARKRSAIIKSLSASRIREKKSRSWTCDKTIYGVFCCHAVTLENSLWTLFWVNIRRAERFMRKSAAI